MPNLILLVVLAIIIVVLVKSIVDAQRARSGSPSPASASRPEPRRPRRERRRERPNLRQVKPAIDSEALAAHVTKLKAAVGSDLISTDEAVASIIRQTDGAVSEQAARKMLQ